MPPRPPAGHRYVPRDPAPAPKTTDRALLPAAAGFPDGSMPPAAAPEASGTTLPALPACFYPSAGPTESGFLYSAIQNAAFPGTANTWTALQTFSGNSGPLAQHTLTDAATGADSPSLRPTMRQVDHLTTATPVAGIGGSDTFRAQDSNGTVVNVGRICWEITNVTPGLVDGTIAFVVTHQGQECETARARGQLGKDATADSSGVYGFLGGEFYVRTYLRVQERFGMNGITPVGIQTLAVPATDPASTQALANSLRSALIAFGLGQ